jgi:hypothetical protein
MEEIMTLRRYLEEKRYDEAMIITIELENMSYDDKILRVMDFAELILLQLIKQDAEKRSARSWERSIDYALSHLVRANRKHRTGEYYLGEKDLVYAIEEAYSTALLMASTQAFEGIYSPEEIERRINRQHILDTALERILNEQEHSKDRYVGSKNDE